MLRLEKSRKEIAVSYRAHRTRLTQNFFTALAIASFLHAAAFFLLKIQAFLDPKEPLLAPIVVEAELEPANERVTVYGDEEKILEQSFLVPIISEPSLLSTYPISDLDARLRELFLTVDEEEAHLIALLDPPLPKKFHIEVYVSGALAQQAILNQPERQPLLSSRPQLVSFQVQVDSKSGQIFWLKPKQAIEEKQVIEMAEKYLKNLHFEAVTNEAIIPGEIEILL